MPDGGPGDAGGEGSAFIIRARMDPAPFQGAPRLLIRLETVGDGQVQHFTDIDAALDSLRHRLMSVMRGWA